MSIVLPQVSVFQEFQSTSTELTDPLRAFIFGPEYKLHRYTVASEKVKAGAYNNLTGNTFAWLGDLNRLPGSVVDQSYTQVYLENALLEYWANASGAQVSSLSYTPPDAVSIATPVGVKNKIKFSTVNLVDKTGYALDSSFYGRNVKVGDYAQVFATVDGVSYTGGGTITGFEADSIAASVGAASSSANNAATQAGSITAATVSGSINLTGLSYASFNGLIKGNIAEVYTITVVRGSSGGLPNTMVLNITSATGKDDALGYVPSTTAWNQDIPLGSAGAVFRFNQTNGSDVTTGSWTVTVNQAFTAPTATASGTYTGKNTTTYVVTIVSGGTTNGATKPVAQVTTTTAVDAGVPVTITGSSGAQNLSVGNFGVVINFNQVNLKAGDQYFIPVTAATSGGIRTIVLDTALPSHLVSTQSRTIDLSVNLCIKKNLNLPAQLVTVGVTNWTQSATSIVIDADAFAFDSTWESGTVALPIIAGDIYIHWRELVTLRSDRIYEIGSTTDLTSIFSTQNDPDNPLVYAAYKALLNSGSDFNTFAGIRLMAVPSNDVAGYTKVLNLAEGRDDVYTFIPLTFDTTIQNLVAAHVQDQSTPDIGQWRIALVCSQLFDPQAIVKTNVDNSTLLATSDSNKILELAAGSTASFITSGVRSGDTVRFNFSTDAYGNPTWNEYTVDTVLSATQLKLTTAPNPAVVVASKVEVWRTCTADDKVTQIGSSAAPFASSRVYNIYPATIASGGVNVAGYFLCAAIAGLIGSSSPQQGLTNVEIQGFDNADNVIHVFSRTQLDRLANYGVWIVTQDLKTGKLYTRHQLSTDTTDLNTRELSVVKNTDSISYFFRNRLKKYIGRANVSQTTIDVLKTQIDGGISYLRSAGFNSLTGGQVLENTAIASLTQHPLLKDRLVCVINVDMPYPLNNFDLHLVI